MARVNVIRTAAAAVLTVGAAVMILRGLSQFGFVEADSWYGARPFGRSVERALSRLEREIGNAALLDSMVRRRTALSRTSAGLTVLTSNGSDTMLARALSIAGTELERMPNRTAGVPAYLLIERRTQRGRYFWNNMLAGDSVCALAMMADRIQTAANYPGDHFPVLLGTCALYLAYGRPGTAARDLFFRDVASIWTAPLTWSGESWEKDSQGRIIFPSSERRYYEQADYVWLLRTASCSRGDARSCRGWIEGDWRSPVRADFVWWLIKRDDGRGFARFWTSNEPVERAFQQSFGAGYDELAGEFGRSYVVLESTGPRLPDEAWPTLAMALIAGLAVALIAGRLRSQAAA